MKVNSSSKIIINKPVDQVYNYSANPLNVPKWYVNIKQAVPLESGPVKVGSKILFVAFFLGKKIEYTYEIRELETNKKLVMSTSQGPFPMTTTYLWERISDNETEMTLKNEGNATGFSVLLAPVMNSAVKRANEKDLLLLKKICESTL